MKSIRTKIMSITSINIVVFLLILGITSMIMNYNSSISQLKMEMQAVAQVTADRVEMELESYMHVAEAFGMRKDIANPEVSVSEKEAILNVWIEQFHMAGANIFDTTGVSIINGSDCADREYFKRSMQGETYASVPTVHMVTGELSTMVSAPIWENGIVNSKVVGVVYFMPSNEFLNDIMSTIKVSENGGAYMIDRDGYTIADTTTETIMVQNIEQEAEYEPELEELAQAHSMMRAGETDVMEYTINGQRKITSFAPIDNSDGWSIGVTAPISDFMGPAITAMIVIAILIVVSIVVAVLIAGIVSKKIATPIRQCVDRMLLLAEGDLTAPVPEFNSKDETGLLIQTTRDLVSTMGKMIDDIQYVLESMAAGNFAVDTKKEAYRGDFINIRNSITDINRRLSDTLSNINISADQVAEGAHQVSCGAQALSQGTTQQASSVEELAATINDITRDIQSSADAAKEASKTASDAGILLENSRNKMNDLIYAMNEINDSSSEIGRIIKTIEDIAFQTNILALNAAVEAARAGEAGKGFAVVADEVRNLAAKSAEASKSTSSLIETSIRAVENGKRIVDDTALSIEQTTESAENAVNVIAQISESAIAQAEIVRQVSIGVDQISCVVQNNSATAEQSAAASEELSSQAALLKQLVGRFQLRPEQQRFTPVTESEEQTTYTNMEQKPETDVEVYTAPKNHFDKY